MMIRKEDAFVFDPKVLESIEVISHSGVRVGGERVIYIDPVEVNGEPHDADIILFTHPHFDHFSPKDAKKLMKGSTVIAAPATMLPMCSLLLGRKPEVLRPGERRVIAGVQIEAVAAYNVGKPFHLKSMKWLGYVITLGETRVYITGDTDITAECRSVSCDILMLPVGGGYTINAQQAAELANAVSPHTVIPIHYGKLLGGSEAPDVFRSGLSEGIQADIRPAAFSSILVKMYIKSAAAIVVCGMLGYIVGRLMG